MHEPEVEAWVSALRPEEPTDTLNKVGITNGSFRYQDSTTDKSIPIIAVDGVPQVEEEFELKDVNVEFPEGKLSLITGPTGSGKTSILLALLGGQWRWSSRVGAHAHPPFVCRDGLRHGERFASQGASSCHRRGHWALQRRRVGRAAAVAATLVDQTQWASPQLAWLIELNLYRIA
jgi:ABC-type uncharacterized transport system ATPase subunit